MAVISQADQSGYDRESLSSEEENQLRVTLERSLEDTRTEGTTTLRDKVEEYYDEIVFAAEVARAQFDQRFDGQNPASGFFGIDTIHSGYFGYDDWTNTPDAGADDGGTAIAWLDDEAPDHLSGNGGRDHPLRVGEDVVHVILGVGSYEEEPNATRLRFVKNDSPRSAFSTTEYFRNTDLHIQWLNAPIVLADGDDIYSEYLAAEDDSDESLYLKGLTFIKEKTSRVMTPETMAAEDLFEETS